jgi:hypothetical protein
VVSKTVAPLVRAGEVIDFAVDKLESRSLRNWTLQLATDEVRSGPTDGPRDLPLAVVSATPRLCTAGSGSSRSRAGLRPAGGACPRCAAGRTACPANVRECCPAFGAEINKDPVRARRSGPGHTQCRSAKQGPDDLADSRPRARCRCKSSHGNVLGFCSLLTAFGPSHSDDEVPSRAHEPGEWPGELAIRNQIRLGGFVPQRRGPLFFV